MKTVRELLGSVPIASDEAQLLLAWLLERDRSWLFAWSDHPVEPTIAERFTTLARQRADGTPIAYLTGEREFWSLKLKVTPDTLIPRPETEHLVEQALARDNPAAPLQVLDLGTGSGAIALALANERPHWRVQACDASPAALAVAQANAQNLQLTVDFIESDWFSAISGRFDLIVSNPPYICASDPHLEQGDLRFEPSTALTSGSDGLDDLRHIVAKAVDFLNPGGQLLVEHGYDQAATVRQCFEQANYHDVHSIRDLAGHERITLGISPT